MGVRKNFFQAEHLDLDFSPHDFGHRDRRRRTQMVGPSDSVRGSYLARVPRSLSARVHREFVHNILEDKVDGQEEGQDDKREDGQQREESGAVEESQIKHMRMTHDARMTNTRLEP